MERKEALEVIAHTIPEKDGPILLDIIDEAIKIMNLKPVITDEEFMALSEGEKYKIITTPEICSYKFSEQLRCIFIRFVEDGAPIANVVYFPIEAIWSFLDTARNYFNFSGTTLTLEEIEKRSFQKAVDMFLIMMRNIYPRVMATMHTITDETINEWYRQQNESYREYLCRQGKTAPSNEPDFKKARDNTFNQYCNEVKDIWGGEKTRVENYQKLRFAEEYEILYEHWDTISLLYRRKKDFLGVAKMSGFEDTPDDLLDELKGSHHRGISKKALEHTARRIGLINLDANDEKMLEKRKSEIPASGYSDAYLYKFLDEGKKILENFKAQQLNQTTLSEVKQLEE